MDEDAGTLGCVFVVLGISPFFASVGPCLQAACIFKNVEEWTSEGGKLHQAAEKMDKFVSEHRWTQSKVKGTSTIVIDKSQTHYIEECFQVVDQSYLKVIKDLPQHLASTGGEKGMFMTSGVQLCSDGSKKPFEETEFKHVKEVVPRACT